VPEAIHASEHGGVRGEEVCSVSEYREKKSLVNAMAKKGTYPSPQGGEAFDEGDDSLG